MKKREYVKLKECTTVKELDRVGSSDNFNFREVPLFLQICKKRSQTIRKKMLCLYGDGSVTDLS